MIFQMVLLDHTMAHSTISPFFSYQVEIRVLKSYFSSKKQVQSHISQFQLPKYPEGRDTSEHEAATFLHK